MDPEFVVDMAWLIVMIALIAVAAACFWPPPEETKRHLTLSQTERRASEEVIRETRNEYKFMDYPRSIGKGPRDLVLWKRCDKCNKMYLKKDLEYWRDVNEYFCKNCVGLAKIYADKV